MKIAVCIKQVPVISMLKFDDDTKRVVREKVPSEVNPFDVLGMSAAAGIRKALECEVVVVTLGPPQAREAIVQCLAMGGDRGIHLVDRAFAGSDTLATSRALSMALRREGFDLIVCGRNSVDGETSQVGPEIAEMLDLPQVTNVSGLELSSSLDGITARRLTEEGHQLASCALPALVTVTEGVAPEVYPSREALETARGLPIAQVTAADLSQDTSLFGLDGSPTWVRGFDVVESRRDGIVARDQPVQDSVKQLLDYLEARSAFDEGRAGRRERRPRGPRLSTGETGAVWVLAELVNDDIRPVTLELLGEARELASEIGSSVEALLIGHGVGAQARSLTAHGADRVLVADDARLAVFDAELTASVIADAVRERGPYAVLAPSTINGRDAAARAAARLGLGLTGDCVGLEIDDEGRLVQLKPAFGGNIVAPILSRTTPQMATVRPGLLDPVVPDWSIEPEVTPLAVGGLGQGRVRVLESVEEPAGRAALENARAIVAAGMGVGGPENLGVVRELADALGAPLGATRDVVDAGWLPRQLQIGLSGKAVAPELYVAVALRGPFNHTVGIRKAGTVVAINNSARAPIFRAADFGILGDYAEVLPVLIEAMERRGLTAGPQTPSTKSRLSHNPSKSTPSS